MGGPATYEQAQSRASKSVWSGCGDGRCMPCGRVHNFGRRPSYGPYINNFRCWQNHQHGCPVDRPAPAHEWSVTHRCKTCGKSAAWVAPDGSKHRTVDSAKRKGFKRSELKREDEVAV